jgi:hypothetical protein
MRKCLTFVGLHAQRPHECRKHLMRFAFQMQWRCATSWIGR